METFSCLAITKDSVIVDLQLLVDATLTTSTNNKKEDFRVDETKVHKTVNARGNLNLNPMEYYLTRSIVYASKGFLLEAQGSSYIVQMRTGVEL